MSDEFATVLSCWSVEEAHLARIRLAAEGIEGHLDNEMMVGMAWLDANAIRGVKLLVKVTDAARAREILDSEYPSDHSAQTIPFQSHEGEADDADIELTTSDEVDDEEDQQDSATGALSAMRSIKGPVIWFFLAPTFIGVLVLISSGLLYVLELIGLFKQD